ncbi:Rieske (2Fe-2S) protein [Halomicrobium urmianum]|uniref:Rieske (2Fe-2S) protein n=1 Tax=Halomicrobium urmianum TaxID=1586233 RepID=UPI001CD9BA0B|nr:Rieske (2Fe-2S) protein [Halomicrobium urmianum]
MAGRTELTSVETVREEGSWLFTATNERGDAEEALLVPCEDGVEAWLNRCTHQNQRLDTGRGAAMRDGKIICPRHGSLFDGCSGYCDNGPAADTTLPDVDIETDEGTVYLVDGDYDFLHEGEREAGDDEDDGPSSTSHIGF